MAKKTAFVLKVTIFETKPSVWRRIRIPNNLTFQKLAEVIKEAMTPHTNGYEIFAIKHPLTKIICNIFAREQHKTLYTGVWRPEQDVDSRKAMVSEFFSETNRTATFTQGVWVHVIELEEIVGTRFYLQEYSVPSICGGHGTVGGCTSASEYTRKAEEYERSYSMQMLQNAFAFSGPSTFNPTRGGY